MSDLFKEMCSLTGKLNDLIDESKDIGERQKLLAIYFKVTEKCEKIAHKEFNANMGSGDLFAPETYGARQIISSPT